MTADATSRSRRGRLLRPPQGPASCGRRQARLMTDVLPRPRPRSREAGCRTCARCFRSRSIEVRLEIGFGGGEHLLHEARHNPGSRLHRLRAFRNGMAKALAAIEAEGLDEHPPAPRRRTRPARLAAGGFARAHRSFSIPIPGRSGATGSAASSPSNAWRGWRAFLRPAASSASPPTSRLRANGRCLRLLARTGSSPGPPSGPTTGGCRGPDWPQHALRGKGHRRQAGNRLILRFQRLLKRLMRRARPAL